MEKLTLLIPSNVLTINYLKFWINNAQGCHCVIIILTESVTVILSLWQGRYLRLFPKPSWITGFLVALSILECTPVQYIVVQYTVVGYKWLEMSNSRRCIWWFWRHFSDSAIGRFLSGGIIPLSCPDLFLYAITLPAVSRDAPATLSYTTLEMASRVLLSSKKPALCI
jgi:hypothetical protein